MCATLAILFFSAAPCSFMRYYMFNMGADSFLLFGPSWFVVTIKRNCLNEQKIHENTRIRYPFDWKSPPGYLVAWLAQFAGGAISGCIYGQFLSVFIASCWLFTFVAEDITQDVTAFNRQSTKAVKCRAELKKRFCDIIQTYSDAKQ